MAGAALPRDSRSLRLLAPFPHGSAARSSWVSHSGYPSSYPLRVARDPIAHADPIALHCTAGNLLKREDHLKRLFE